MKIRKLKRVITGPPGVLMNRNSKSSRAGLSLVELVVLVAVMGILVIVTVSMLVRNERRASRIGCGNNLKNAALAFRIFATDNNDMFPAQVLLSNGVGLATIDAVKVFRELSN